MIKVGDPLPNVTVQEYSEVEGNGCSIGPNAVKVSEAAAGKTIAVFAVPGAFTHLFGQACARLRAERRGVQEGRRR